MPNQGADSDDVCDKLDKIISILEKVLEKILELIEIARAKNKTADT